MKHKTGLKKSKKIISSGIIFAFVSIFMLGLASSPKPLLNEIYVGAVDEENETTTTTTPTLPEVSEVTTAPEVSEVTTAPEVSEETTIPEVSEETTVPEVSEETTVSEVSEETTVPEVSEETTVPEVSEETTVPEVSEETTVSEVSEETTLSEVSEETTVSDTSDETTVSDESDDEEESEEPIEVLASGSSITINSSDDLIIYSQNYQADPAAYYNIDVSIAITAGNMNNLDGFVSIGTAEYPFAASLIIASSTDLSVTLDKPLFAYISDSAQILDSDNNDTYVAISRSGSADTPLFAANVVHDSASLYPANWTINIDNAAETGGISYDNSFCGVIGTLCEGSKVDLTVNKNSSAAAEIKSAGDAGIACQHMKAGSELTVSITGINTGYNVTSVNGNAGGLVGSMESGSALIVNSAFSNTGEIKSAGGYAGGLAGYAADAEIIFKDLSKVSGNIIGGAGTGGVFGYYRNTAETNEFDIAKYNVDCTLNGENAGGVFGKLENSGSMIIKASADIQIAPKRTSNEKMTYGGFAGTYLSDASSNSLIIRGITVNVDKASGYAENYGGFIGKIDDASYVKFENVDVNANFCSTNVTYFGGLVGYVDNGFIDAENVAVNTNGEFIGGGVVGKMNSGVLRLGGTTDLGNTLVSKGGQIIGVRGNQALVYAKAGWIFIRSNTAVAVDDIGTWGEVLRFSASFGENEAFTVNETEHTVTVNGAKLSVSGLGDFANLALNIQMNNGAASDSTLIFTDTMNTSSVLLNSDIILNSNIDLSGTGITGLTRDDGKNADGGDNAVFTGSLNGNNHTVTLGIGEPYGYRGNALAAINPDDTSDGNGRIYRHYFNGLFATTGDGARFQNVAVDGIINVNYINNARYYSGGLCAQHMNGAVTAENVIVKETIDLSGIGSTNYYCAGGIIGNISEKSDAVVTIRDCEISPVISYVQNKGNFICGGAIGEINSTKTLSVDVDDVKLGAVITNYSISEGKKVGGFIGNISNFNGNPGIRTMSVKNMTIDGAKVSSSSRGALLGEAWNNLEVTVGGESDAGIAVQNSTVIQSGSDGFAGLLTAATGYWKVYDVNIGSITVDGKAASSFGMFINKGMFTDYNKTYALYLELAKKDAYKIAGADLSQLKSSAVFDEILTTCSGTYYESNDISEAGKYAVVSIHTSGDMVIMDGASCNTYQNQTSITKVNPNTRYYYNLDVMREKGTADLTAPEKLMLWSVKAYAYDSLKKYFTDTFNNTIPSGNYDMTGYSYYPTDLPADITIESGSSFTFCNDKIESSENGTGNSDYTARTTTGTRSQHFLMHCGLFRNSAGSITAGTGLTFSGCIGADNNYSGALVCDTIAGSSQAQAIISLNGLVLDGIRVNGNTSSSGYAPLLINKIDSYTDLSIKNVITTEKYTADGTTSTAATSLIGNVGKTDESSANIKLTFSGLAMDGRKKAVSDIAANNALDNAYKTKRSIFSKATLLNSFRFKSGSNCSGTYNFKLNEDWNEDASPKHNVTYGSEISDSAEYNGLQEKYLKSDTFTDPTKSNAESEYSFAGSFLPYVAAAYSSATNYHEIKVNQSVQADLDVGCGTYNDPYIISYGKQLELVDKILSGNLGVSEDGTIINYKEENYRSWCLNKSSHTMLIWDPASSLFVTEDRSTSVNLSDMQNALATAYYKISEDVTISSADFLGIGKKIPFKGVIYGNGNTIINKSTSPLIFQSKGAVLKDLNVEISADFSNKYTSAAGSKYETDGSGTAAFYGGLIGIVNGGDNIIDKVSVSFAYQSTINIKSGNYYGNKAVGGYIGVVRYGGVYFRNMDEIAPDKRAGITKSYNSIFNTEGDLTDNQGKILLYCNPIIGRVIDGFAVTESDSYKPHEGTEMNNGTKNYFIADIDRDSTQKISFNDKVITVPDSQSLFLMGCIAMSGAGSAGWNGNYPADLSYGNEQMVRYADYDRIGDPAIDETYTDFLSSKKDNFGSGTDTVPYIIYKYTEKNASGYYPARSLTKNDSTNCVFTFEMTRDQIYDLPDSFRGIGSLNNSSDDLKMHISGIKGNNAEVKLNSAFYAYKLTTYDQYYRANLSNTNQNVGLGLFNNMVQKSGTVSDLTLSGNVSVKIFNSEGGTARAENGNAALCAGMLAGTSNNSAVNIQNVILSDAAVDTRSVSGGLIGIVYSNGSGSSSITSCKNTNSLTVGGGDYTGGLVGYICGGNGWKVSDISLSGINITGYTGHINNTGDKVGAGGLIGYKERDLELSSITVENSSVVSQGSAGGILCRAYGGYKTEFIDCNVINTNLGSENTMFTGGVLGLSHSFKPINMTRCKVSGDETSHNTIQGTYQAGGLSAWIGSTSTIDGCIVENYDIKFTCERLNSGYSENSGGFLTKIGGNAVIKNSRISDCSIIRDVKLGTKSVGGVIGDINSRTVTGYNIAMENVQIMDSEGKALSTGAYGDISGANGTIKLVGVSMPKTNSGIYAGKNFGTSSGYVIFADYKGVCLDETAANKEPSEINKNTVVDDMGAFPYATVNPKNQIDKTEDAPRFLTGDGADIAAVDSILSEIGTEKGYKNARSDYTDTFKQYESKRSTFNEKTGADISNDFSVLVINDSNYRNVTNMLNSYIHILTNDVSISNYASADSNICKVDILPFRLNEESGHFETKTEYVKTLEYNNSYFKVTDKDYDGNYKQFTLIDIQYYDPAAKGKIAYHLYIPVFVEKMLDFDFRAAALSGTTYNTSFYSDGDPVLESYGTPVTAHITYSYRRTAEEWQNVINSGENLLKGYGKSVLLKSKNDLPADTMLVLVDKNNSDRAYYSTIADAFTASDEKLDLGKFRNSDNELFEAVSFCELLNRAADITVKADASGTLVKCGTGDISQAVICIGDEHYRKKTDADTSTSEFYSVSVSPKANMVDLTTGFLKLEEEYYISFFTKSDNDAPMRNILLCCNTRLDDDNMTPSHLYNADAKESMVHMILGNLYDQTFSFKTTGGEIINENNKTLTAELKTVVSLKPENASEVKPYLNDKSIHLYHGFIIEAIRKDENTTEKGIKGNPQVTGTYKIGSMGYPQNYSNTAPSVKLTGNDTNAPVDIKQQLINNSSVTITCGDLQILYSDEESIIAQFPERKNQSETYGVTLYANSNLAYVPDNIEQSNISVSKNDENGKSYYRENIAAASLSYNIPLNSPNEMTKLGINGWESNDKITAVGYYNVLNLPQEEFDKAKTVKFTLSLYQKNDEGSYEPVDIGKYLTDVKLYDKNGSEKSYTVNDDSYEFAFDKVNDLNFEAGSFEVRSTYSVITGADFESGKKTYANYKVQLTAQLLDENGNSIANSSCSDHIIYTNAKIYTEMISAS